jgi:adenosylcobinamide-GDP ribazoletransferase
VKDLFVAFAFLTRLPVRVIADPSDVGRAARWFPLIGAVLGGAGALAASGLHHVKAMPPVLSALLLVGLGAWVTGAIHLDGLADMVDGFGGGRTREEVLRIMRDPRIGSFGATALVLVVATKVMALSTLLERDVAIRFILVAPVLSRWTIVALAAWLPYARVEGGLGQAVTGGSSLTNVLIGTVFTLVIAAAVLGVDAIVTAVFAVLTMAASGVAARRRLGGVTGDVFGASVELSETAVLIAGVLVTRGT